MRSVPTLLVTVMCFAAVARAEDRPKEDVRTFTYKKVKQTELPLYVHFPADWKKEDRRPVVVFFFGGGWTNGKVTQFEPQANYLAGRGLVAARADYRVKSRQSVTPDQCVEDAKSAIRWVRQNAAMLGVDPDRIVAAGGSAGGHIAACTGCCPGLEAEGEDAKISSRPNAMLLYNPVLRFDGIGSLMERINKDEKLGKMISPTLHIAKDTPPALILFGKTDQLLAQGEEFAARSKDIGNRVELFTAEGVGHGFFNRSPWQDRTTRRADEFLRSIGYLKGEPTIRVP